MDDAGITRAVEYAKTAHGTQLRKYTGEPYWIHPLRVAQTVKETPGCTPEMIQAALLHDTIEDTDTTYHALRKEFGELVASYVLLLTDPPKDVGNRAVRKAMVVEKLRNAPKEVKTIKLADLLDNAPEIIELDPEFAKVFIKEKAVLLEALRGGDDVLWHKAKAIIDRSGLV